MTSSASIYFRVLLPMHFPVQAAPNEFLSVWAGEPNLWVFDASGEWVLRRRHFPEGKLWTVLYDLLDAGVIRTLSEVDEQWLRHPLPAFGASSPPTLRVIRPA